MKNSTVTKTDSYFEARPIENGQLVDAGKSIQMSWRFQSENEAIEAGLKFYTGMFRLSHIDSVNSIHKTIAVYKNGVRVKYYHPGNCLNLVSVRKYRGKTCFA